MRVGSKTEFYRLWLAGALGNGIRTWDNPTAALRSAARRFGVREASGSAGRHWIVPRDGLRDAMAGWGGRPFVIDETAPDEDVTLQGEVMRAVGGWTGTLGLRTGMRMRAAAANGLLRPMRGLAVKVALDTFMDPSSRDDVEALLELFPEAVVEFACYPYDVGVIPGRNTIIWEVRDY